MMKSLWPATSVVTYRAGGVGGCVDEPGSARNDRVAELYTCCYPRMRRRTAAKITRTLIIYCRCSSGLDLLLRESFDSRSSVFVSLCGLLLFFAVDCCVVWLIKTELYDNPVVAVTMRWWLIRRKTTLADNKEILRYRVRKITHLKCCMQNKLVVWEKNWDNNNDDGNESRNVTLLYE